jgi:hypothetical protein
MGLRGIQRAVLNSGSFATLAAILRASSLVNSLAADRTRAPRVNLA